MGKEKAAMIKNKENFDIDWKKLYDLLSRKYQGMEQSLKESQHTITRIKKEEEGNGSKKILNDIVIPLLYDFENLRKAFNKGCEPSILKSAISLIDKNSKQLLSSANIDRIQTDPGTIFNPSIHDAVSMCESEHISKDCIVEEISAGYTFENTLLKPARVVVSSGSKQQP